MYWSRHPSCIIESYLADMRLVAWLIYLIAIWELSLEFGHLKVIFFFVNLLLFAFRFDYKLIISILGVLSTGCDGCTISPSWARRPWKSTWIVVIMSLRCSVRTTLSISTRMVGGRCPGVACTAHSSTTSRSSLTVDTSSSTFTTLNENRSQKKQKVHVFLC